MQFRGDFYCDHFSRKRTYITLAVRFRLECTYLRFFSRRKLAGARLRFHIEVIIFFFLSLLSRLDRADL